MLLVSGVAFGARAPNPRDTTVATDILGRDSVVSRRATSGATTVGVTSRNAIRRGTENARSGRSATNNVTLHHQDAVASRAASSRVSVPGVVRSATNTVRSATPKITKTNMSRASSGRATALFNDVSKIGGGYSACREAWATCMDQFCGNANDTYRRCYCSDRFTSFRETEATLDAAKGLLQQFEDNNLAAVTMSVGEVNAMYTATVGEAAIKKDTSAAQNALNEISDLLSGKKKPVSQSTSGSLGIMSFDFTTSADDIWGGGDSSLLFSGGASGNISDKEGGDLYRVVAQQCLDVVAEQCQSDAVLSMAQSAYNIMITQDCNAYEKNIDKKREAVESTIRTAEKYLREARLEDYRAHNTDDVNDCVNRVKNAMLQDTACGANYKRCMDYTGVYINQTTGDPIYSQRLFQLNDLIVLDGRSSDVLAQNKAMDNFLNQKKVFANSALDSCRNIADTVWTEFKRAALIEIAQAQDEKIEEVKMSCVSTMKECYDTQSGALKGFDGTSAQSAGAVAAYTARDMCVDKVNACASLYGDTGGCQFDGNGKLKGSSGKCGLKSLLDFVETVDNTRVAEGCGTALESYLKELCTPTVGDKAYPWNCRSMTQTELQNNINQRAQLLCADPVSKQVAPETTATIEKTITDLKSEIDYQLGETCEELGGYWVGDGQDYYTGAPLAAFYSNVYGTQVPRPTQKTAVTNQQTLNSVAGRTWGYCYENSTLLMCMSYNIGDTEYASYDLNSDTCSFTDEWYKMKCESIGGVWDNTTCYMLPGA